MKYALLITNLDATYTLETAVESFERWGSNSNYSKYNMQNPVWVQRTEDGKQALILFNSGLNNPSAPMVSESSEEAMLRDVNRENMLATELVADIVNPEVNDILSRAGGKALFVNESSSTIAVSEFAGELKKFAAKSIWSPNTCAAMESAGPEEPSFFRTFDTIIASMAPVAVSDGPDLAAVIQEHAEIGTESAIDDAAPVVNNEIPEEPTEYSNMVNPTATTDIDSAPEVSINDLDDIDIVNASTPEDNPVIDPEATTSDITPSVDSDDKVIDSTNKTPNKVSTELLNAFEQFLDENNLTPEEFFSKLGKLMTIIKTVASVPKQMVADEPTPVAVTPDTVEAVIDDMNTAPEEEPISEEPVTEVNSEDIFGYVPEDGEEEPIIEDSNVADEEPNEEELPLAEVPEDADAEEALLIKLANESKSETEFWDKVVANKRKISYPVLMECSQYDMRRRIRTGEMISLEAEVSSERLANI